MDVERVIGTAFSDALIGNALSNTLVGGDGNDQIRGGGGADNLDGGTGNDVLDYTNSPAAVLVALDLNLARDRDTTDGNDDSDAAGDIIANFENIIGSSFADFLQGSAADNILRGGAGADTLIGLGGNDTISYASSALGVSVVLPDSGAVQLAATFNGVANGDAAGDIVNSDIENISGSNFNDFLRGNSAANILSGGIGDDILRGAGGADILIGGDGTDTADYSTSAAAVTVNLSTGVNSGGDAAGDTLSSIENVTGSAGSDNLTGNSGANRTRWRSRE